MTCPMRARRGGQERLGWEWYNHGRSGRQHVFSTCRVGCFSSSIVSSWQSSEVVLANDMVLSWGDFTTACVAPPRRQESFFISFLAAFPFLQSTTFDPQL